MKESHIHIAIFSTAFAVLLWFSIALTSDYQTIITLPLVTENLRPTRSLAKPLPAALTFKVRGTGWQLLRLESFPGSRYVLDLSDIVYRKKIVTKEDCLERLRLPVTVQILEVRPETLSVALDERIRKTVPVLLKEDFGFREGYGIVGSVHLTPDSVTLTGAQSLLRDIASWETKALHYENLKTGIEARVELAETLSYGITLSPTSVLMQCDIQPTAEKTFSDVPVEVNHVPDDRTVVLIPPTIGFVIRGGVNQIASVDRKDFKAYIDFKTILLDTTGRLRPSINGPRDIRIVNQQPEIIQYVVRK